MMFCPECGEMARQVGETVENKAYECRAGHEWVEEKNWAAVERQTEPVGRGVSGRESHPLR